MVEKLRKINDELLILNKDNIYKLKKHTLIKKILQDDKCFFKISIEYAYTILRDLGFKEEELKSIYMELISINNLN